MDLNNVLAVLCGLEEEEDIVAPVGGSFLFGSLLVSSGRAVSAALKGSSVETSVVASFTASGNDDDDDSAFVVVAAVVVAMVTTFSFCGSSC
jgi:hypothetical protein